MFRAPVTSPRSIDWASKPGTWVRSPDTFTVTSGFPGSIVMCFVPGTQVATRSKLHERFDRLRFGSLLKAIVALSANATLTDTRQ